MKIKIWLVALIMFGLISTASACWGGGDEPDTDFS